MHLQILLIYYILSSLKLGIILNKKVVPNDNFKFGSERVKKVDFISAEIKTIYLVRIRYQCKPSGVQIVCQLPVQSASSDVSIE